MDNKTFICCKDKVYESKQKLYEIDEYLINSDLLRVSKSVILNLSKIKSLSPVLSGRFEAVLDNDEKLIISRQYVSSSKKDMVFRGYKMPIKDLIKIMFHAYFIIKIGVVVSMYDLCLIFNPNGKFSTIDIGGILLVAFISDLYFLVFSSNKELDKKQMLLRSFIHIPMLLAMPLYFAHLFRWANMKSSGQVTFLFLQDNISFIAHIQGI